MNSTDDGPGTKLAEQYGVKGRPYFILMTASGEPVDRWVGFHDPAVWLANYQSALTDPTTVKDKKKRFDAKPAEGLAVNLARINQAERKNRESVRYYREAARLAGSMKASFAREIFDIMSYDRADGGFTIDEVKTSADALMAARDRTPVDALTVASTMSEIASEKQNPGLVQPYIAPALAASEGVTGEDAMSMRKDVEIAKALFVDGEPQLAVELKKQSMPEGWQKTVRGINDFASWCFQNKVNTQEAEELSKQAIELANEKKGS